MSRVTATARSPRAIAARPSRRCLPAAAEGADRNRDQSDRDQEVGMGLPRRADVDGRRLGDAAGQVRITRLADLDPAVVDELGGDQAGAGERRSPPRPPAVASPPCWRRWRRRRRGRRRGAALAPRKPGRGRTPPPVVAAAVRSKPRCGGRRPSGRASPLVGPGGLARGRGRRPGRRDGSTSRPDPASPADTAPMRRRTAAIIGGRSGSFFAARFAGPAGAFFLRWLRRSSPVSGRRFRFTLNSI